MNKSLILIYQNIKNLLSWNFERNSCLGKYLMLAYLDFLLPTVGPANNANMRSVRWVRH
jgi:hypothetical protein